MTIKVALFIDGPYNGKRIMVATDRPVFHVAVAEPLRAYTVNDSPEDIHNTVRHSRFDYSFYGLASGDVVAYPTLWQKNPRHSVIDQISSALYLNYEASK